MSVFSFNKITMLAAFILPLAACVSEQPTASLNGMNYAKITIVKRTKGTLGTLPAQLAETMTTCWSERDELFEGFKVQANNTTITLNGPIIGNPPQRFVIRLVNMDEKLGYTVTMEYPVGSNYAFVRSRLARDLKKLEAGIKPCN